MSNDEELSRTAKRLDYAELFDRVRKMKEDRVPEANAPVPDAPPATPPVDVAWLAAAKFPLDTKTRTKIHFAASR